MQIKKSRILLITILLLMFLSISSVSAEENSTSDLVSSDEDSDITINTPVDVDVNSTKKVEFEINITDSDGEVSFDKNDLTISVNQTTISDFELKNKNINFILDNSDFITTNMTIGYKGLVFKTITLNRVYNSVIEPLNTAAQYQVGNYSFKVTDVDTNSILANKTFQVIFNVEEGYALHRITKYITTNDDGIATLFLTDLRTAFGDNHDVSVGEYSVNINGLNQIKYTNTTRFTIEKADVLITANQYSENIGSNKKFIITITSKLTGEIMKGITLLIYIPNTVDKYYTIKTDSEGKGELTVSRLAAGEYNITISTNDTKVNNVSFNSKIIINKISVKININSVSEYYNSGETTIIKITNAKTGSVVSGVQVRIRLYEDNQYKDYGYKSDSKGLIKFSTSLNVGLHKMIVSVIDNTYDANQITKTINVKKASAKITASKITYYYNDGKYLVVKLTNTKNKKAIFNGKISFKIYHSKNKYTTYHGTTQLQGKITFNVNLKPGTYKVVVSGEDSKNFNAKSVTTKITVKKSPAKITPKKITTKKGLNKYFQVKVTNKKTKNAISKVQLKLKVFTGKKAKTYTVKTNNKGIAKLNVKSLKVGTHKVKITIANKYYTSKTTSSSIKIKK